MRVKICGIKSDEDIEAVSMTDVDAVGFLVGQVHASPDFILPSTARRLASMLPPFITPVVVTHLTESEKIVAIVEKTEILTVQLHGAPTLEEVEKLRDKLPATTQLVYCAHIDPDSLRLPDLRDFQHVINAVVVDSFDKRKNQIGGTGKTHNWTITADYIKTSSFPVILAGGLDHENVQKAIQATSPYGVDANTGLRGPDNQKSKDFCELFVKRAKQT